VRALPLIFVAGLLTACGADGDPTYPRESVPPRTTVETNVGVGDSGVSGGTSVRTTTGPFTFGVGIGL